MKTMCPPAHLASVRFEHSVCRGSLMTTYIYIYIYIIYVCVCICVYVYTYDVCICVYVCVYYLNSF